MYLTESDPTHTCNVAIVPSPLDSESADVVETSDAERNLEPPGELRVQERYGTQRGSIVGRYRLKRCLGRGTTGSVWNAEDLEFAGRDVALKLMHADVHDEYVLARYTCEVRALARMDDPCIARIWENGRSNDGKLYIAMELVQGIQLTKYCEAWSPTIQERIRLVVKLCRGMQHAHQRGILHRDLKPANILVSHHDGEAHPKIIDFGLAKSIHQPLMPGSVDTTQMGCLLGTIGYMSPEQASTGIRDVDTRSDVYSIGVVLYELLTGSLPVPREELNRVSLSQALEMVQNRDVEAASRRVQRLTGNQLHAARCQLNQPRLLQLLRGDLDAILEKALTKERSRRYQSAGELADDLERYLSGGVVQARRRTWWYLMQKMLHRHWKLALSVFSLSLLFLISWIGMALGLYWAVEARDQAQQARASLELSHQKEKFHKVDAEKTSEFLETVFTTTNPFKGGADIKLLEALDRSKVNLAARFTNHPRAEAMARLALGRSYLRLGRLDSTVELLEPVLQFDNDKFDGAALCRLHAENLIIQALIQDKQFDQAQKRCEQFLKEPIAQWLPEGVSTLRSLYQSASRLLVKQKRFAEAVHLLQESMESLQPTLKVSNADMWSERAALAATYADWATFDHAIIPQAMQVIETLMVQVEALPENHLTQFQLRSSMGRVLVEQGNLELASRYMQSLLDDVETKLGEAHGFTQVVAANLSKVYLEMGLKRQAKSMLIKLLKGQLQQFGPVHQFTELTFNQLILLSQQQGQDAQALGYGKTFYQGCYGFLSPTHPRTVAARKQLHQLSVRFVASWMLATAFK